MALCWNYPDGPVPEETFNHLHPSRTDILYQLPSSTMIHSILLVQCSICVLNGPFRQPLSRSSSWSGTLHTPYISSCNHLFATHAHTIIACFAVVPILFHLFLISPSSLLGNMSFYLNATHPSDHSHLCLLQCHLIFFPYRPGLTSMQHTVCFAYNCCS